MAHVSWDGQQMLVSSFLEIAVGQTTGTARQFLEATSWNLEEAIQLFYTRNDDNAESASASDVVYGDNSALYNGLSRNSEEAEQTPPSNYATEDNSLVFLYRPSYELLYEGPFEYAKDAGAARNKWLLVNVQSTKEFSSVMLNRDTWANEIVAQAIKSNFVFWQEDEDTEEGKKVCSYYKLHSLPVILVIDPITGQKMRSWNGMVAPEELLEDAMCFMDRSPTEYHANLIQKQRGRIHRDTREGNESQEIKEITNDTEDEKQLSMKKVCYLPLPEEPKCDKNLLCRIAIRLPDGRKIQRNFLKTDSIKLLWSFCSNQLGEAETRPFRFTQAIPGASKFMEYESNLTFEESGLANSIVSVIMI
ncbi:unnamed protein product [Withania somnifera]